MRTPEQVKQARRKLENLRRENALMEEIDAKHAAQVEKFLCETSRIEARTDAKQNAWNERDQKEIRFKIATAIAGFIIWGIVIVFLNF